MGVPASIAVPALAAPPRVMHDHPMYKGVIDMRSDTVTRPTPEMRQAMYDAEVGDDVLGDDPTVIELERTAAEMSGKEAALFVASGTMGNQVSLFTHCAKGEEIILSEQSHVVQHEAGAAAHLAGAHLITVDKGMGCLAWQDVEPRIRDNDIHCPRTALIHVETPLAGGDVVPLAVLREIHDGARRRDIRVHMDGARIFNAASWLKVPASEIASTADSVMFCLSKGLCSPVGSMVAGSKDFIAVARRRRKIMGGGMRQVGILAAAGLISLRRMTLRLHEDREKAASIAAALRATGACRIEPEEVKINMFFVRFTDPGLAGRESAFLEALKKRGVRILASGGGWMRFVAHNDVSFEDAEAAAKAAVEAMEEVRAAR